MLKCQKSSEKTDRGANGDSVATLCTVGEVVPCMCRKGTAPGPDERMDGGFPSRRRKVRVMVTTRNRVSELESKEEQNEPPSPTDSESEEEPPRREEPEISDEDADMDQLFHQVICVSR